MDTRQQLIVTKVEQLQELQVELDRVHQEQSTLLHELAQLTSAVEAYTLSPPTKGCADSQGDPKNGCTESNITSLDTMHISRGISTPDRCASTKPHSSLQVGDHIYIKNKILHSNRPSVADRAGVITAIAQQPKQQVFLTTYTGVETWRSPLNIRHLTKEERARLQYSPQHE